MSRPLCYLALIWQVTVFTLAFHSPRLEQHACHSSSVCSPVTVTVTVTALPGFTAPSSVVDTLTSRILTSTATTREVTNSTATISVSRAGSILQPSAAAEANPVDTTAIHTFSRTTIKNSSGQCLTIDATTGDFRENLIPITLSTCDGGQDQQWDVIISGKHNDIPGLALIVSSLTNGCINFDPRRIPGDQVILFSCGGRADGGGAVTDSQLFPLASGQSRVPLSPQNTKGATCLVNQSGKLGAVDCDQGVDQMFTFG